MNLVNINLNALNVKPYGFDNAKHPPQRKLTYSVHSLASFTSHCITMTSHWVRWRLKSPTSRLFTQPFVHSQIKEKHQSSASLAFVRGIHRRPVYSPHKRPVTRKRFPFDDVIMGITSAPVRLCPGTLTSDAAESKPWLPIVWLHR